MIVENSTDNLSIDMMISDHRYSSPSQQNSSSSEQSGVIAKDARP